MAKATKKTVSENREDLSRFVVHLTRDHEPGDAGRTVAGAETVPARNNLLSMLMAQRIEARAPHCMVNPRLLKDVDEDRQKDFHVVCLTEVPLNQIHLLTQEIEGRVVKMKPYGLIFHRDIIIRKGGQPAIYVNGYGGNTYLKEAVNELYDDWLQGEPGAKAPRFLPFVNIMHEGYDFAWEREWRILEKLEFTRADLVAIILPPNSDEDVREVFAAGEIAVISPGWTYEQIVSELSSQQRTGKKIGIANLKKLQQA